MRITGFLVACGLGMGVARAVGPEVHDNAGIFSAGAIRQADEAIRNIQKDFRKDLLIETFAGVPDGRGEEYTRNREEFFATFVGERARSARVDGIYVMIMKEPPPHRFRIQVGVGQATRQRAFVPADRDELVGVFQAKFRADQYDEGLRSGVAFVERTLRSHLQGVAASAPAQHSSDGRGMRPAASHGSGILSFLLLGMFIVGGIFVVGFIIRMLRGGMNRGGTGVPGTSGFGGGGGGFISSLLGGVGGAIAGSWLYDRFLGGNAHASDNFPSSQSPDAPSSDIGGDYSSSGGDVGGGGGDFGGGGGDFGGGGDA